MNNKLYAELNTRERILETIKDKWFFKLWRELFPKPQKVIIFPDQIELEGGKKR